MNFHIEINFSVLNFAYQISSRILLTSVGSGHFQLKTNVAETSCRAGVYIHWQVKGVPVTISGWDSG